MKFLVAAIFAVSLLPWAGCAKQQSASTPHLHEAAPPHGGTPVALGDDYQIEWVLDAPAGQLQAYVLDGEMENFVRITPPSFDLTVNFGAGAKGQILHFTAVANPATGETVGDTSLFQAQADWLKKTARFSAVLPALEVKGTAFSNISFTFPK